MIDKYLKTSFKIKIEDIGRQLTVRTGSSDLMISVTEPMVGYYLGQFIATKKTGLVVHSKKTRRSKKG